MKKTFRRILIIVLALGLLAASLHFWLVHHAETLISEAVRRESKGKVILELQKMDYNYRTRQLRLKNAVLYNKAGDTLTAYRFRIPEMKMRLVSLRQLIFYKRLGIDSITISSPEIEVTRMSRKSRKSDVSLSTEMGRVYNEIRRALEKLQIRQMQLKQGKFVLRDQTVQPASETVISRIDLQIDDLNISDSTAPGNDGHLFFAEDLRFSTTHQHIDLPGGKQRLGFSAFRINMKEQAISIDSFYIESLHPDGKRNRLKAAFDSVRLIRIDFKRLYNDEVIAADSVYCSSPNLRLSLVSPGEQQRSSPGEQPKEFSLRDVLSDIGTRMELRYVGLRNATLHLRGGKENKEITFRGDNRLMEMNGLHIDPDGASPLKVDRFLLEANNYESYSPDSLYQFKLSSIGLEDQTLRMENVSIRTHLLKPGQPYRDHSIPLLTLNGIDWPALLFDKKIVAAEVLLTDPVVFYRKKVARTERGIRIYDVFDALNDLVTVRDIRVQNGRFHFELPGGNNFEFTGVDGGLHGKQLLYASNSREMEQSVAQLHIRNARLNTPGWQISLNEADFRPDEAMFTGKQLLLNDRNRTLVANAYNFSISSINPVDSLRRLDIGNISWDRADIQFSATHPSSTGGQEHTMDGLSIGSVTGENTHVRLALPRDAKAGAFFRNIHLRNLNPGHKPFLYPGSPFLATSGDSIYYTNEQLRLSGGRFSLSGNGLFRILAPALSISKPGLKMNLDMESLETTLFFQSLPGNDLHLSALHLYRPEVHLFLDTANTNGERTAAPSVKKGFEISEMTWHHPAVHVYRETPRGRMEIHPQWKDKPGEWTFSRLRLDAKEETLEMEDVTISDSFHIHLAGKTEPTLRFYTDAHFQDIHIPFRKGADARLAISRLFIPVIKLPGNDEITLQGIQVQHNRLLPGAGASFPALLRQPGWNIGIRQGSWSNGREMVKWDGVKYLSEHAGLTLDSFRFSPLVSRDSFFRQQVFETDYITASGGFTSIQNLRQTADSVWRADTLRLSGLDVAAYRDKRLPFQHGAVKPMPTQMLEEAGFPFSVRQVIADSMNIVYGEWNDKTDKEGFVRLTVGEARLHPVTTVPEEGDSLFLSVNGLFMEDIPFQVRIGQPYRDTVRPMHVYLLAGPGALTGLNTMLPALASLYIKSGRFSQLKMEVDADKNGAEGEMLIRYQNLHLRLLKKGNLEKKGFFPSIATFLADHLLLKHSNQYRKAVFKHQRNTEKSVFNYLVKIIIKGLGTNTGLVKSKKNKK